MVLPVEKRALIIQLLTESSSIRASSRIVGCSKNTVTKLLIGTGRTSAAYQDKTMRTLRLRPVECDEIWSFVYTSNTTSSRPNSHPPAPAMSGHGWRSL